MPNYPDFSAIDLKLKGLNRTYNDWNKDFQNKTGKTVDDFEWMTNEQIPVSPLYTFDDYKGLEHLDFTAGISPNLRGPYATMYVTRPWTVRQYAGFSTAEESNAFYKRNLAAGQRPVLQSTQCSI